MTIYPYNTPAEEILAAGHDGVMLSNGPGDPADNTFCIEADPEALWQDPHVRHLPGTPDDGTGRRR
ncbi:MAG: glutamine amidotransferase-related protein [Evtepia sp.]